MKVPSVKYNNPTIQVVFDELNVLHFEGKLKRIPLRVAGANSTYGTFYPEWCSDQPRGFVTHIMMARHLLGTERSLALRETLLHEMCHYWLWHRFARIGRTMNTDLKRFERFAGGHRDNFRSLERRVMLADPILGRTKPSVFPTGRTPLILAGVWESAFVAK